MPIKKSIPVHKVMQAFLSIPCHQLIAVAASEQGTEHTTRQSLEGLGSLW